MYLFSLWLYFVPVSTVSVFNFEKVSAVWVFEYLSIFSQFQMLLWHVTSEKQMRQLEIK